MPELCEADLERYLLGLIQAGAELTEMEEHLKGCPACRQRAQAIAEYISTMRQALRILEWEELESLY
jgi:anti-sigma factor RsiW